MDNIDQQRNLESLVVARTEQLRQTLKELEEAYDMTLTALGDALDLKERDRPTHSKRVTAFSMAISRAMGLSSDRVRVIARGAYLHDIGKMAIPDAILMKPGRLDPAEAEIMREHCKRGYEIVRKIPFLAEAAEIVYAHHEKYDGTGYPRGLKGEGIPLGARIVAVVNTLDVMTNVQPYRTTQPYAAAREEIQRWSGRQFDPQVVEIFLSVPEKMWPDLLRDLGAEAPI